MPRSSLSPKAGSSKPVRVGDSLQQHLHMYALAASAAGVSMLALVQPGEAEIVYTPANVTIGPGQHYNLDLNNDGITDFVIRDRTHSTTSGTFKYLFVQNAKGNTVAGHIVNYGFPWAYALNSGMRITKNNLHFVGGGRQTMAWSIFTQAQTYPRRGGSWAGSSERTLYLGLRFKIAGEFHYAWARMSVTLGNFSATLTGYAYETIPNKAILAGQEQGNDKSGEQPAPAALTNPDQNPATLGMLALGSPALPIWRRPEDQSLVRDRK